MKKTLAIAVLGLFLLTSFSLAQDLPIQNPEELQNAGLCGAGTNIQECVAQIFQIVFKTLIYVAGALAVIMFVLAGISYIFKGEAGHTEARGKLVYGAVGLVIALASYVLVQLLDRFARGGGLQV